MDGFLEKLAFLLGALTTIPLWIVLHEAGHVLMGKLFANAKVVEFKPWPRYYTSPDGERHFLLGWYKCAKKSAWTSAELSALAAGPAVLATLIFVTLLPLLIALPTHLKGGLFLALLGAPVQILILGIGNDTFSDTSLLTEQQGLSSRGKLVFGLSLALLSYCLYSILCISMIAHVM